MISTMFHTQKIHAYNLNRRPTTLTECSSLNFTGHFTQVFFFMAQQPLLGQGFLIVRASRTHTDTQYSSALLWTSDQPVAGTST